MYTFKDAALNRLIYNLRDSSFPWCWSELEPQRNLLLLTKCETKERPNWSKECTKFGFKLEYQYLTTFLKMEEKAKHKTPSMVPWRSIKVLKLFQVVNRVSQAIIDLQLQHLEMLRHWFLHKDPKDGSVLKSRPTPLSGIEPSRLRYTSSALGDYSPPPHLLRYVHWRVRMVIELVSNSRLTKTRENISLPAWSSRACFDKHIPPV